MKKLMLGCIADDFTGATDLANNLVRAGMRVVQTIGVPASDAAVEADAVVVALKSRTIAPDEAISQSLAALSWLRAQGARQIYFKVCSTFDSTDRGNIGPVAEALADALDAQFVPVCPAFPENQRTVFKGHLFVGDLLLSDSSMRHHPLTPMADASLVRVLQRQCRGQVGLVDHGVVRQGADAEPEAVKAVQSRLGVAQAGELVEQTLSTIARGLVERGVRQLVVAGGETSGACVQALEVAQMRIGRQIDPGVPWCHAHSPAAGADGLLLALKSGNFGTVDFFTKAFGVLG